MKLFIRFQTSTRNCWNWGMYSYVYCVYLAISFWWTFCENKKAITVPVGYSLPDRRHNEHGDVSNHQRPGRLLNHLFRLRAKKTSKLRITGLCGGNSPMTVEFPTQKANNAENVSIWWRHHAWSQWASPRKPFGFLPLTLYVLFFSEGT